jgi:hypothetical protein
MYVSLACFALGRDLGHLGSETFLPSTTFTIHLFLFTTISKYRHPDISSLGHLRPRIAIATSHLSIVELGFTWLEEFKRLKRLEDLERVICQLHDDLVPGAFEGEQRALLRIALAYGEKHDRTQAFEDYQALAMLLLESSNAVPENHPTKIELLPRVIQTFEVLSHESKSIEDMTILSEQLELFLRIHPGDGSSRAAIHHQLAHVHILEFEVTEDQIALDRCIQRHRTVARTNSSVGPRVVCWG